MGDVFSPSLQRNDLAPYETLGFLKSKCSLLFTLGISLVNKKAHDQVSPLSAERRMCILR